MRDIVQLALDYNLIVADEEIAMAFLPTGKIRPYGAEDEWDALLGELAEADEVRLAYEETKLPTTEYDYSVWIRPLLDKGLGDYGFKLVKIFENKNNDVYYSWYCREVEIGQQYLKFVHVGSSPYFWSHTSFYMECPVVQDIYNRFDFANKDTNRVFLAELQSFTDVDYYTASPLSEDLAQRHINDVINYIIKPIFDKTTDIKGLDNFVNGWLSKQPLSYTDTLKGSPPKPKPQSERTFLTPDRFRGMGFYCPQQLIVARLANNPEYEKLRTFFEAKKSFGANDKARATEWPKLVQYLEEAINPNTFWQQHALLKEELIRLEEDRIQQFVTQFKLNPEQEVIPVSDQWYDAKTNLIWQRCCMGQHWQNGQVVGKEKLFNESEKQELLEQFKDSGWRLPTYHELLGLSFAKKTGYVTKQGFNFYEQAETVFFIHWIKPYNLNLPHIKEDVHIFSVRNDGSIDVKLKNEKNLVGYLRLGRTAPSSVGWVEKQNPSH
ncbi:MAG: hypothetical protein IPL02_03740 [Moraxellaceae bacterium]|nr:hypothetical protein [Moraxellaceae bacterium]